MQLSKFICHQRNSNFDPTTDVFLQEYQTRAKNKRKKQTARDTSSMSSQARHKYNTDIAQKDKRRVIFRSRFVGEKEKFPHLEDITLWSSIFSIPKFVYYQGED